MGQVNWPQPSQLLAKASETTLNEMGEWITPNHQELTMNPKQKPHHAYVLRDKLYIPCGHRACIDDKMFGLLKPFCQCRKSEEYELLYHVYPLKDYHVTTPQKKHIYILHRYLIHMVHNPPVWSKYQPQINIGSLLRISLPWICMNCWQHKESSGAVLMLYWKYVSRESWMTKFFKAYPYYCQLSHRSLIGNMIFFFNTDEGKVYLWPGRVWFHHNMVNVL